MRGMHDCRDFLHPGSSRESRSFSFGRSSSCTSDGEDRSLICLRKRLVDVSLRERVRLLWTIEGRHGIRIHKGLIYMYHPQGAFQLYKGYPPETAP